MPIGSPIKKAESLPLSFQLKRDFFEVPKNTWYVLHKTRSFYYTPDYRSKTNQPDVITISMFESYPELVYFVVDDIDTPENIKKLINKLN